MNAGKAGMAGVFEGVFEVEAAGSGAEDGFVWRGVLECCSFARSERFSLSETGRGAWRISFRITAPPAGTWVFAVSEVRCLSHSWLTYVEMLLTS